MRRQHLLGAIAGYICPASQTNIAPRNIQLLWIDKLDQTAYLLVAASHSGNFFVGQIGAAYTVQHQQRWNHGDSRRHHQSDRPTVPGPHRYRSQRNGMELLFVFPHDVCVLHASGRYACPGGRLSANHHHIKCGSRCSCKCLKSFERRRDWRRQFHQQFPQSILACFACGCYIFGEQ